MSGIVGSRFNIRGSGLVGSLGTDGQVFTSAGAGKSAVFEAAAGGGKILQCVGNNTVNGASSINVTTQTATATGVVQAITPQSASNIIYIICNFSIVIYDVDADTAAGGNELYRDINGGGFEVFDSGGTGAVDSAANFQAGDFQDAGRALVYNSWGIHYLDSSYDTTDEVTYKVYIAEMQADDTYTNIGAGSGLTNIVLMEIDQS